MMLFLFAATAIRDVVPQPTRRGAPQSASLGAELACLSLSRDGDGLYMWDSGCRAPPGTSRQGRGFGDACWRRISQDNVRAAQAIIWTECIVVLPR
jgi:hypothetical protein